MSSPGGCDAKAALVTSPQSLAPLSNLVLKLFGSSQIIVIGAPWNTGNLPLTSLFDLIFMGMQSQLLHF